MVTSAPALMRRTATSFVAPYADTKDCKRGVTPSCIAQIFIHHNNSTTESFHILSASSALSTCLVPSVDRGPLLQEKVDGIGVAGEGRMMQWRRSDLNHVLCGQEWRHIYQSGQLVEDWCRLYLVKHFRVGGVWLFIVDNL